MSINTPLVARKMGYVRPVETVMEKVMDLIVRACSTERWKIERGESCLESAVSVFEGILSSLGLSSIAAVISKVVVLTSVGWSCVVKNWIDVVFDVLCA